MADMLVVVFACHAVVAVQHVTVTAALPIVKPLCDNAWWLLRAWPYGSMLWTDVAVPGQELLLWQLVTPGCVSVELPMQPRVCLAMHGRHCCCGPSLFAGLLFSLEHNSCAHMTALLCCQPCVT